MSRFDMSTAAHNGIVPEINPRSIRPFARSNDDLQLVIEAAISSGGSVGPRSRYRRLSDKKPRLFKPSPSGIQERRKAPTASPRRPRSGARRD